MAIRIPFPEPDSRREALYEYLVQYLLQSQGRPPTMREIIDARVGEHTAAGALTSTSVVKANLAAMARQGWIVYQEGESRRTQLVGGYYIVAPNILQNRVFFNYGIFIVDESAGINEPVNPEIVDLFKWCESDQDAECYTLGSGANTPDVWEAVGPGLSWNHIYDEPLLNVLASFSQNEPLDFIAVITRRNDQAALAAAAGCGVFSPSNEEHEWELITADGQRPSTLD